MSKTAKATFLATSAVAAFTVWGVHYIQVAEREAMYQGVLRDDERQRKRREQMAREAELEEQKHRRAYLEKLQPVSSPEGPPPEPPTTPAAACDITFGGCKTC